jgi:hypothetical protein
MKKTTKTLATALLLILGYSELVIADTQPGAIGRKKSKAGGTDQYVVTCSDDGRGVPHHLYLELKDLRPRNPAQLSIQAMLPATGAVTPLSIDARDGDFFSSPGVTLVGGVGPYLFSVNKSRSSVIGAEIYVAVFHCETADGTHTGTSWEMILNQ